MKYNLKLDYTADELKELKKLTDGNKYPKITPMSAISYVWLNQPGFEHLRNKYTKLSDIKGELDLINDLTHVAMGTAIFPEKKYYIVFPMLGEYGYFYDTNSGRYDVNSLSYLTGTNRFQFTFTEQEIKDIDVHLLPFKVGVDDE